VGITQTINHGIRSDVGAGPLSGSYVEYGTQNPLLDVVLPAGTVDQVQAFAFPIATLQSVFILSDQNVTLKTNSSSSPANTINLKAGNPLCWSISSGYFACPFGVDVTQIFLTAPTATRFRMQVLKA
jgi:hypothetical protein